MKIKSKNKYFIAKTICMNYFDKTTSSELDTVNLPVWDKLLEPSVPEKYFFGL